MALFRRLLRTFVVLVLVVLAFAAGATAVLTLTQKGRDNLAGMISRLASSADSKVTISGLGGIWSGALRIDRVVLEDAQGPWLAARDIAVDWSPRALLGRTFRAERVAAARVEVARLPAPGREKPGSGPFSLPVDVAVEAIDLPDIALGEALTGGQIASVSATGRALAKGDPLTVDADLSVVRSDGVAGSLAGRIAFAPTSDRLEIDLKASEPSGGILANLLGLPGKPAVDIAVSGTGPVADWHGTGSFAVDGAPVASVSASHRLTDAGHEVEARGEGDFASFLPQRFRAVLGGRTTFDIAGTATPAGGVLVERADISGAALTASAAGQFDPEGATDFSLEVAAQGGGVPLSFGTEESPIDITVRSVTLRALGDGSEPGLDIAADLPSASTNDVKLTGLGLTLHSDGFDLRRRIGPFTGGATAQALVVDSPAVEPLVAGEIRAGLEGTLEPDTLTVASGTLRSDAIDGSFGGKVSLADGSITLDLKAGVLSAALPAAARPLLGEQVSLATSLERDSEGNVSANALSLVSGGLSASGSARLAGGQVDARLEGRLADIAPAVPGGSGGVSLSATATGPLAAPQVAAKLSSERVGFGARAIDGLVVSVKGTLDSASPDIAATVGGTFEGQALDGQATLSSADGSRVLRDLSLALGENRVSGTLSLDEAFVPEGTLRLDLPALDRLAALAGQTIQGAAQGTAVFGRADGMPQVALSLSAPSVARDRLVATELTIEALVKSYLGDPAISGRLGATVADLVPGQPPVVIDAGFEGAPADLSARGTLSLEGEPLTRFTASHRSTPAGSVVAMAGDAMLERLLPPNLRRLVAGGVAYDVAARLAGDGGVTIEHATATTAALSLSAAGTVGPAETLDIALDVAPAAAAAPLSLGTQESPLDVAIDRVRLRATGPAARPALDLSAELASVVAKGVALTGVALTMRSDGFDTQARSGTLSATATIADAALDNAAIAPLAGGTVRAEFAADVTPEAVAVRNGSLRSDALDARFDGSLSLGDGVASFGLKTDVASAALPAAARPALGETVRLAGTLARDAEGAVSVSALTVASGPLQAEGSARLAGEVVDAQIKGTLGDVAPLAGQARGAIGFSATAKGPLSAPGLDLAVSSERLVVAERVIENLALRATGTADPASPSANVALTGTVGGQALAGKAVLETAAGKSTVRDLAVTLGPNRIAGALSLDAAFVPEGTIDLDLPDIGPLAALALESVEGSLNGRIVFERGAGEPRIAVKATSASIVRGDLRVADVAIDASVANYLRSPAVAGTVRARQVTSGTTVIGDVAVDLGRDGNWTTFDGGATVAKIPLRATGRVAVADGVTTVELASAQAAVEGITAQLARAATVRIADGVTMLDRLALSLGDGGTATVSGRAGSTLDLEVVLAGLPASLANRFAAGLDASGTISGTVQVSGAASSPTVAYQLDWTGAQTAQTRSAGIGALTVRSSGTHAGNRLTFDATAGNGAGLDFRGGGTVTLAGAPQLDLTVSGSVPLAAVSAQLAAQDIAVSGTASVDLAVRGAASAPAISGTVRASGARLVHVGVGIAVNDIVADIALGAGRATINRLSGTLSTGGTVSGSGTVGIAAGSNFPADLTIRVADGRYTDGRVVTTTVSADLAIRGPLIGAPTLTGTVDLARTVIAIPESLPASLRALDVRHKNAPPAVQRQAEILRPAESSRSSSGVLTLDVTVNAPQRIFVQGRGLDAELGGSLRLVGPVSAPQATGGFELRRGRLLLLGRRLTFNSGHITFNGSLVPDLDFEATSQAGNATVTVHVLGPANNPQFSFTSTSGLPEDEVLAQLLFGRAMSSLSPVQLAQLADAAAQLAGAGGSTSLLGSLRERLGVDNIDVGTDAAGGANVRVGKYLNDRTFLSIESGEGLGSSRATIDLDVGRGVRLRGSAGDDGDARAGIFFEREY